MKINWKVILGIVLTLTALAVIAIPLAWRFVMPNVGYSMTGRYGMHMPMLSGYGMLAPFGMWFMWLLPLGVFTLVGFAFGWAANRFTNKTS